MAKSITNQEMMMMIYQILGEGERYLTVLPGIMVMGNGRECIFGLTEKHLNIAIQEQVNPSIMTEDIRIPIGDICKISVKKGFMGKTEVILSRIIPGTEQSFPYKLLFLKKPRNCDITAEDYRDALNTFIDTIKENIKK